MIPMTAESIWKELEAGRAYKSGENLYNTIAQNERFKIGDQWKGMQSQNLPPTVYNFIGQVANTQVSSVLAEQVTINRFVDELSRENPVLDMAVKAFEECDKRNWERCKMDALNEDVLMDAYVAGLGATYWFWDDDIITGNEFLTKGDIKGEILDSVSLYVSNPNDLDIQNQEWVIISARKTVAQLRKIAKANGASAEELEAIVSDETLSYEAYDKAQNEQDGSRFHSNQATMVTKLYKEGGKVWCVKSTANVILKKPHSIDLELYPIAIMNWEKRKKFIYGSSPVTSIIPNQKVANLQASMRHLHAQLLAIPKVIINKSVIQGFTNTVGGINYVNLTPGQDVGTAIKFVQPTAMTMDVDKSIDDSITRTRDLMGANQNALGEGNTDNFRAIVAQQKAAGIPLESVKRRFFQYLEDVALIWMDFYKNKYALVRRLQHTTPGGEQEMLEFTGTDFSRVYMQTKIEVGASSHWSELLQLDAMNNMWDKGVIQDPIMYLEALPDNILPNKEKMIEKLKIAQGIPLGPEGAPMMGQPQQQPSQAPNNAMAGMVPPPPPSPDSISNKSNAPQPIPMSAQAPQAQPQPQGHPQGEEDMTPMFEAMAAFMDTLPPEVRAKVEALPEGQQELVLVEMMKEQGVI